MPDFRTCSYLTLLCCSRIEFLHRRPAAHEPKLLPTFFDSPWTNDNVRKRQVRGQNISNSHLLHFNFIISQEQFSNPVIVCNQAPVVFSESLLQCWVACRYWEQSWSIQVWQRVQTSNDEQRTCRMVLVFAEGVSIVNAWGSRRHWVVSKCNLEVAETAHKLVEWVLKRSAQSSTNETLESAAGTRLPSETSFNWNWQAT